MVEREELSKAQQCPFPQDLSKLRFVPRTNTSVAALSSTTDGSAAHCVTGKTDTSIVVVVGTATLNAGGVGYNSCKVIYHSSYNVQPKAYDVSLIKTMAVISFNVNVAPISLPTAATGGGVSAVVSGWGYLLKDGNVSNQLMAVNVETLTNADCKARFLASFNPEVASEVTDVKICTFNETGKGICQGDSGGPLTAGGAVIGIVSWNIPCAIGYPDGYERVFNHRLWIFSEFFWYFFVWLADSHANFFRYSLNLEA